MAGPPRPKTLAPALHPNIKFLGEPLERWFKELTHKRLRRGVFTNVPELIEAITTWGSYWNDHPKPFIWHTSADEIIEEVQRGCATLNHQANSTSDH